MDQETAILDPQEYPQGRQRHCFEPCGLADSAVNTPLHRLDRGSSAGEQI